MGGAPILEDLIPGGAAPIDGDLPFIAGPTDACLSGGANPPDGARWAGVYLEALPERGFDGIGKSSKNCDG